LSSKIRLDALLFDKKLAESRNKAQRMIMAGEVKVNGVVQLKPSYKTTLDAAIEVEEKPRFVSRGGLKLEPALIEFGLVDLRGKVCVDVGSSTGGFTDCMLTYGAEKVFAIHVGYGILHWKLRNDSRVVVMERTNARYVHQLPEPIDFVTIDASFISLHILLPVIKKWLGKGGDVVALIKPQFEAGRKDAAKNDGVIRDHDVHRRVLTEIMQVCVETGFSVIGLTQSSIQGPKGNIEFLVHLAIDKEGKSVEELNEAIIALVPIEDDSNNS
jgi:23S rRNA (cytidine1920-2'-O)/16S rRNA (cytidine1409-2'-O)-methyltransferase